MFKCFCFFQLAKGVLITFFRTCFFFALRFPRYPTIVHVSTVLPPFAVCGRLFTFAYIRLFRTVQIPITTGKNTIRFSLIFETFFLFLCDYFVTTISPRNEVYSTWRY